MDRFEGSSEDLISESEEIQQLADIGKWEYDRINNVHTWSLGQQRIYEIGPDEVPKSMKELLHLVHPDDRHLFIHEFPLRLLTEDKIEITHRIIGRKSGELKYVRSHVVRVRERNQIRGYKGISQNITAQVARENQINELLVETQNFAKTGGWEMDVVTQSLFWYPGEFAHYEVTKPPATFSDFIQFIHPEDRHMMESLVITYLSSRKEPTVNRFRIITPKGRTKVIATKLIPVYVKGRLTKLRGVTQDLTDCSGVQFDPTQKRSSSKLSAKMGSWNKEDQNQLTDDLIGARHWSLKVSWIYQVAQKRIFYSDTFHDLLTSVTGGAPHHIQELLTRIHPDDAKKLGEMYHLYRGQHTQEEEFNLRLLTSEKRYQLFRIIARPVFHGGRLTEIMGIVHDGNSSRMAYEQLLESEERFSSVFKNSAIGKAICTPSGHIQDVNFSLQSLLGYSESEFIQVTVEQIVHPNDFNEFNSKWMAMFNQSKETFQFEHRLMRKDGQMRWVITTATVIRYSINNLLVVLQIHDITEKVNSERKVVEYQQKFISAFHGSSVGMMVGKIDGNFTEVNDALCHFLGYSRKELLQKGLAGISHPDDVQQDSNNIRKMITGEINGFTEEKRYVHKSGKIVFGLLTVNSIRDEMGQIGNMIAQVQDISKIVAAQVFADKERKKFEHLFKYSGVGMALTNTDGKIMEVNQALCTIIGYSENELLQLTLAQISHPGDAKRGVDDSEALLKGSLEHSTSEKRYIRKGGEIIFVITTASLITDSETGQKFVLTQIQDINESKREEIKRLEIEERYRHLVENAHLGITFSKDEKVVYANKAFFSMFEFSDSEDLGNFNWLDFASEETKPILVKRLESIHRGKKTDKVFIGNYYTKKGALKTLEVQGKTVKIANESYRMAILTDLTDRLNLERTLRETQKVFDQAQQFTGIGSWRWTIESGELFWSDSIYKLFGFKKSDKISHDNFMKIVHPDDREKLLTQKRECLVNGKPFEVEHRIVGSNGKIKWMLEKGNAVRNRDGKAIEMYGIVREITAAKRSAEELSISKNKYQLLAESGQELICLHSLDGHFLYASPSLKLLLGYDPNKIPSSLKSIDLIHPEDHSTFNQLMADATQKKGDIVTARIRFRSKQGRYLWCEKNVRAMLDQNGKVVSFRSLTRNIDSQVEFENRLKETNDQLEKTLAELKEASEAKENFLSIMSHEIRTPLNSVIGLSNVLIRRDPRPDQIEVVKTLKTSADNLMHLVNDILDFNKIRSGKVQLVITSFSLHDFLKQIHAGYKLAALDKNLNLLLQVDPKIPGRLKGDTVRLNQVFTNLLTNALKFTLQGQVKMNVSLKEETREACTITFRIADTGVGIPEDKQEIIFQPFLQSDANISRQYGGTGLGLSIVKSLVELMNGKLSLESVPGKGSVFSLEIKLQKADDKAFPDKTIDANHIQLSKKIIEVLYVEDVESNRFLIESLLKDNNIKCIAVSSGRAALRLTASRRFDLILMDIQMPGMDGYQATQKIRHQENGKNRKTAVIAFTAEPYSSELKNKIIRNQMQYVISKPFDADLLIESIRKYANTSNASDSFFSFAFYEETFNNDRKYLKKFTKSLIDELMRFDKNLAKNNKVKDVISIRSEVHKIKPIVKNLRYYDLTDQLNIFRLYDQYTPEVNSAVKESRKLTTRLLNKLRKLDY